ncbi:MAG TPA: hypothetical protein VG308_18170 [Stellaceae bacterium]|jgi:putative methyltransferase (TIGR04325 family)|nr:hypothetical protein [Stellaceae bacterium]
MNGNRIKAAARRWLPGSLVAWLKRRLGMPASHWEYVARGWPARDPRAAGWAHPSVAAALQQNWPAYASIVTGTAPLGLWPLAPAARDELAHNLMMTFGYVLARAGHGRERLSVLDWGGSIGHYALAAQALLPELALDYTIRDLPELRAALAAVQPGVTFAPSDEAALSRQYDLVFVSNAIQYAPDWRAQTTALAAGARHWLFLTCIPVVRRSGGFVIVQRPYAYDMRTEYISWVFDRGELLAHLEGLGLTLVREFLAGGPIDARGAPEIAQHEGFLLRRDSGSVT